MKSKTNLKQLLISIGERNNFMLLSLCFLFLIGFYSFLNIEFNLQDETNSYSVEISLPSVNSESLDSEYISQIEKNLNQNNSATSVITEIQNESAKLDIAFHPLISENTAKLIISNSFETVEVNKDVKIDKNILPQIDHPTLKYLVTSNTNTVTLMKNIKPALEQIKSDSNIKEIRINGNAEETIIIQPDQLKLEQLGISNDQILNYLKESNFVRELGLVKVNNSSYKIKSLNSLNSLDDIRNLIVNVNDSLIPLSELCQIRYESNEPNSIFFQNKGDEIKNAFEIEIDFFKQTLEKDTDEIKNQLAEAINEQENINIIEVHNETSNYTTHIFSSILICSLIFLFRFISKLKNNKVKNFLIELILNLSAIALTIIVYKVFNHRISSYFFFAISLGLIADHQFSNFHEYKDTDLIITELGKEIKNKSGLILLTLLSLIIALIVRPIYPLIEISLTLFIFTVLTLLSKLLFGKSLRYLFSNTKLQNSLGKLFIHICFGIFGYFLFELLFKNNTDHLTSASYLKENILILSLKAFIFFALILTSYFGFVKNFSVKKISTSGLNNIKNIIIKLFIFLEIEWIVIHKFYKSNLRNMVFSKYVSLITYSLILLSIIIGIVSSLLPLFRFSNNPLSRNSEKLIINLIAPENSSSDFSNEKTLKILSTIIQTSEIQYITLKNGLNILPDDSQINAPNLMLIEANLIEKKYLNRSIDTVINELEYELEHTFGIKSYSFEKDKTSINIFTTNITSDTEKYLEAFEILPIEKPNGNEIEIKYKLDELARKNISINDINSWLSSIINTSEITNLQVGDNNYNVLINPDDLSFETLNSIRTPENLGSFKLGEVAELKFVDGNKIINKVDGKNTQTLIFKNKAEAKTETIKNYLEFSLDNISKVEVRNLLKTPIIIIIFTILFGVFIIFWNINSSKISSTYLIITTLSIISGLLMSYFLKPFIDIEKFISMLLLSLNIITLIFNSIASKLNTDNQVEGILTLYNPSRILRTGTSIFIINVGAFTLLPNSGITLLIVTIQLFLLVLFLIPLLVRILFSRK